MTGTEPTVGLVRTSTCVVSSVVCKLTCSSSREESNVSGRFSDANWLGGELLHTASISQAYEVPSKRLHSVTDTSIRSPATPNLVASGDPHPLHREAIALET